MDPAFGSALGLSYEYDHWTDGETEEQRQRCDLVRVRHTALSMPDISFQTPSKGGVRKLCPLRRPRSLGLSPLEQGNKKPHEEASDFSRAALRTNKTKFFKKKKKEFFHVGLEN